MQNYFSVLMEYLTSKYYTRLLEKLQKGTLESYRLIEKTFLRNEEQLCITFFLQNSYFLQI